MRICGTGAACGGSQIRLTPKAVTYLDSYYTKNRAFIESLEEQLTEEDIMRLNQAVGILSDILPKLR